MIDKAKKLKNSYKLKFALIAILMIFVTGMVSYGAFFAFGIQEDDNILSSSCFSTNFTDGASINLDAAMQLSDEDGLKTDPYTFTIKNTCNLSSIYYVILNTKNTNLNDSNINISSDGTTAYNLTALTKNTKFEKDSSFQNSYIVTNGTLENGKSATYNIRIWLNETATEYLEEMSWEGEIKVISTVAELQTQTIANMGEDTSGANTPNLDTNLIPVVYDKSTETWVKTAAEQSKWYNYNKQIWANAVTVVENKRNAYNNAGVGTIIPMDDILGMYVWIPRYEYQYTNLGTTYAGGSQSQPGGIGINFISGISTTETANYIIHPAFRNGSVTYTNNAYTTTSAYQVGGWDSEITGFWFAKFETTGLAATPTVKPDMLSLRSQTVGAQYSTAQQVSEYHGITLDSHMSKNSEWGAVAYLTQSNYGKYGNEKFTGTSKEVYFNNSYSYFTGRSMGLPSGASGYTYTSTGSYKYNDDHFTKFETTVKEGTGTELNPAPTIQNDTEYPWTLTNGVYKSTTSFVEPETDLGLYELYTSLTMTFKLEDYGLLSFDWTVSSEGDYDYLEYTLTKDGTGYAHDMITGLYFEDESELTDSVYSHEQKNLEPGEYILTFTYYKDGSYAEGTDTGYIKNISIKEKVEYTQVEVPDLKNGVGASTTGNIYGIYDMSGGARENTMANYNGNAGSSGITMPSQKYYDKYTSTTIASACGSMICYGQALSETSGWYSDSASLSSSSYWSFRGGYYSNYSGSSYGIFYNYYSSGSSSSYASFRIVLT